MKHKFVYALAIVCAMFGAYGERSAPLEIHSSPPELRGFDGVPNTLAAPPVRKIMFGDFAVEFNTSTLVGFTRTVGLGKILHQGDAANSEYWVCYTISSPENGARIWLSSGEGGGTEHEIDSIRIFVNDLPLKSTRECPELPEKFLPVSLGASIQYASTSGIVAKGLGRPSAVRSGWNLYSYSGKFAIAGFEQSVLLGIRFSDGKAVSLFASQDISN